MPAKIFRFKKTDNLRNQLQCLWKPENWLQHILFQLYRGSYLTTHAADPTNVTRPARTPDLSKQNSHLKATAWWCNFRACKKSSSCKTCPWQKKQTQLPEVPPQQIWLHCHLNSQWWNWNFKATNGFLTRTPTSWLNDRSNHCKFSGGLESLNLESCKIQWLYFLQTGFSV